MMISGPGDLRHAILQRLALASLPKLAAAPAEPASAPVVTTQTQPQPSVAMLVAIAASDPRLHRQRITAAADKGLRMLEALVAEGRRTPAMLQAISTWMADHEVPDDPAAAELLRAVELRVLVELAKAERDS